jgi:hypothetical protein
MGLIQFAFGCRHGHMSSVFTIKKRSYRVCLSCGREFDYAGPLMPFIGGLGAKPSLMHGNPSSGSQE